MILFAAIVPPESVVSAALDAVRRAAEERHVLETAGARKSSRWGLGRRTRQAPPPDDLVTYPLERIHVNVARFGNLTTPDAIELARVLVSEGGDWRAPTVRLAGATVLESPRLHALALTLAGDLDDLATVARNTRATAQRLGIFLDRRDFRAALPVAPVPDSGPGPAARTALADLADFVSEPWTVTEMVVLGEHSDTAPYQEIARVQLG